MMTTKTTIGAVAATAAIFAATAVPATAATAQRATATTSATALAVTAVKAPQLQPWPVLKQGANSGWPRVTVRSLQYLLVAHGAKLPVDGVFGHQTKLAVEIGRAHV